MTAPPRARIRARRVAFAASAAPDIAARADNLDIAWLRGSDDAGEDTLEEPRISLRPCARIWRGR